MPVNRSILWNPYLWLGVCIPAFIIFVIVIVQLCRNFVTPPQDTTTAILAIIALLTVAAILFQVFVNHKQWEAMQDGLTETRKTIEQSERSMMYSQSAYVSVGEIVFEGYRIGERPNAMVKVYNTGTTPAYNVLVFAHLYYKKHPFFFTHTEVQDWSDVGRKPFPSVLGPHGDDTTQPIFFDRPLDARLLELEKTQPLHFWGLITYTDIFGRDRWTEFCYRKILLGQVGDGEDSLAMNESGNDADKPDR